MTIICSFRSSSVAGFKAGSTPITGISVNVSRSRLIAALVAVLQAITTAFSPRSTIGRIMFIVSC